jgi:two-component system, NtrC family, sensor kinase
VLRTEFAVPEPGEEGRAARMRFAAYQFAEEPFETSVVVHYQDVTKARALEERLRESERLAAVGQLASGAAHEINNPLGFVTSNLRTLRGMMDELRVPVRVLHDVVSLLKAQKLEEAQEHLQELELPDPHHLDEGVSMIDESLDGARRVSDIVKGLRELSRLEIGKPEPAQVNASVSRAVRAQLGDNPPNLHLDLRADAPAAIAPLQLDQALGNILRNARQATPRKQAIRVETWNTEREVLIRVSDDGAGIAKEHMRRVFEPFFTTRGVGQGLGLGLTAAYGIVRRAGGDIEVASGGPSLGAAFTVRLPRA